MVFVPLERGAEERHKAKGTWHKERTDNDALHCSSHLPFAFSHLPSPSGMVFVPLQKRRFTARHGG
jgi:hypothetical protein